MNKCQLLSFVLVFVSTLALSNNSYDSKNVLNKKSAIVTRGSFLQQACAGVATMSFLARYPEPALAKEVDPAVKGTKSDPAFQACISKCVYECTLPKGEEQKSRAECLPECKQKCAKTKEQLMMGSPKK